MLRSDLVATFVTIVESGSLNAAAIRLGISRSVVSDRLTRLEADLGAKLVVRSTHGLSLSLSGERFLPHARELMSAMETARDAVADAEGAPSGLLRVAVPLFLGAEWLSPVFARFLDDYPKTRLDIAASDTAVDIIADGFDLAIRSQRPADSDLIVRDVCISRRMVVCSPSYVERHGLPATVTQLSRHERIGRRNRRDGQDWNFDGSEGIRNARGAIRYHADNSYMILEAAKNGIGLGLLPTFIVARDVAAGRLVPVPLDVEPEMDVIAAVYPQANRAMPRIQVLVDRLKEAWGDPPPWDRALAEAGHMSLD